MTVTAPAEWFTGQAWIDELAPLAAPSTLKVDSVHFAPGARTVWHHHPLGQVLHITAGAGLTTFLTHLAMQEVGAGGVEAERGEPVTDAEYQGA
jgi:quercetin dioxygenase-like cupin family protein